MADTKISDLTLKATPVGADTSVIVDSVGGANKKVTLGTLPVSTAQQTAIDAKVSDTAYDATSWNGVTTIAPSKNAVRDEVEVLVTSIAGKEPTITATTAADYYRGDKTFQTLNKTAVGLSNVDNTSDATKNSASVSLTNKTIDADLNTITNIEDADIKAGAAISLSKLAATTASRALVSDGSGAISPAATTSTEIGYVSGVTSAIQTQINNKQTSDATLTALAAYNTNGLLTQTAADTFTGRSIASGLGTSVSNGDGVSGNPTVAMDINGLSVITPVLADSIPFYDASGATIGKSTLTTLNGIIDHDSLLNYSAARHKLHPTTTTDNTISRYDGVTGDLQASGVTIDDSGNMGGSLASIAISGLGTYTGASTVTVGMVSLTANQSWGFTSGANYIKAAVQFSGTHTFAQDSFLFGAGFLFNNDAKIKNTPSVARSISSFYTTNAAPVFEADGATVTQALHLDFTSQPQFTRINAGAWNCSTHTGFSSSSTVGAGCTLTTRQAFAVSNATNSGTLTTQVGVAVSALTSATNNTNFLGGGSALTGNFNMCQIDQYANRWNGAQGWKGRNITAATTLLATDHFISVSAGGTFNLQLPLANANGSGFRQNIIVRNDGGGTVTMTLSGADGLTGTATIATGTSKTYISNGTATWFHIATA